MKIKLRRRRIPGMVYRPDSGEGVPTQLWTDEPTLTRGKAFFMLDQNSEAMRELIAMRLPATTLNVFLYALSQIQINNVVALPYEETAQATNLAKTQVAAALKMLKHIEAIAAYREDRRILYMVNPAFGWNGVVHQYPNGLKRWEKLVEAQRKSANEPKFAHLQTA